MKDFISYIKELIFSESIANGIATLAYMIPKCSALIYIAANLLGIAWSIGIRDSWVV